MVKRITAALALIAALAGCSSTAAPPREDEPGWNCHTQGNHICGPLGPVIHRVVVDPGQPQRGRWWVVLHGSASWTWRPVSPNAAREAGLTRTGVGCYEHLGATSYAVCPEFWYSS